MHVCAVNNFIIRLRWKTALTLIAARTRVRPAPRQLHIAEASFYHRGIDHILICGHGGGDGKLMSLREGGGIYEEERVEKKIKNLLGASSPGSSGTIIEKSSHKIMPSTPKK